MRRLILLTLALLVSTALSASLAACRQVPEGGSPSLRVSPSSSPTATNTPKPPTASALPTNTPKPPTETPTPTATLPEEVKVALLSMGYTLEDLKPFSAVGFSEYPIGGINYNGLVGSRSDGSQELLGIKFDEITVRLTEKDILDLNSELVCEFGNCFYKGFLGTTLTYFIDVIATGIIQDVLFQDQTGETVGFGQSFLAVTRANDGQPRLVNMLVQIVKPDNPGINIIYNHMNGLAGRLATTKAYTHEELAEILSRGKQYNFGVFLEPKRSTRYPGQNFVIDFLYNQPGYLETLKALVESDGQTAPPTKPLIIYSTSVGKR